MTERGVTDRDRQLTSRNARLSLGTTGLRQSGGYIVEDFLPQLRGWRGARYYGEMIDNCAVIGMSMTVIESLVRQVAWPIKTAQGYEDDDEAIYWRDRLEEMLEDMEHTWEDFIAEVLSMLPYGFAPFETVYKVRRGASGDYTTHSEYDDGLVGFRKIEIRSQETVYEWDFDREGTVRGFWQVDNYSTRRHGGSYVYIPMEKVVLFRAKAPKNNPEGRSMLRSAVREYHYLKRLQENEAIGIGKDLTGMVVMEVPREIMATRPTPDDLALRRQLEKMVQELQVDERMGAVFPAELDREGNPTGFKLKLLSSGGGRQIAPDPVIRRYEMRIASSFLTEFMLIGQDKVGAMNLHESKSNLFGVALNTVLDTICATFNRFAVARVMRMNGAPREKWPYLGHGNVFTQDLAKLGAFLQSMSVAGLLSPNKALEQQLLEEADLPVPHPDDDIRDDFSVPTPADGADLAMGVLSDRQIAAVIQINERLESGTIGEAVARELLASALGMGADEVGRFITQRAEPGA